MHIYLDNHNTTKPSAQAVAKMVPYLLEKWTAPNSPNILSQQLCPVVEDALKGIYALFNAKENDTVLFTSSAAEGINHVIFSSYFDVTIQTGKNQFITSNMDEAPIMLATERLHHLNCLSKQALCDQHGRLNADAVADVITPRTALVSMSTASGLTGIIHDIKDIALLCQDRGIKFHVDASHSIGKLYDDFSGIPIDFISFSGDKIHAPSGTGALFIRETVKCSPFIIGGNEQAGLRGGSYSVASLVALGQAARECIDTRDLMCTEVARLRARFEDELTKKIPNTVIFFQQEERLPSCVAVGFSGIFNEALLYLLNRKGVYATIGGGSLPSISHLLESCGIESKLSHSALSFGLSYETTENEIDMAVETIAESVKRLRQSSKWFDA